MMTSDLFPVTIEHGVHVILVLRPVVNLKLKFEPDLTS